MSATLAPHSAGAARTREKIVGHGLNGLAHGNAQNRAIYNPDPEINSALEHVLVAARTTPAGPAREHLAEAAHLLKSALAHGNGEAGEWKATIGEAERIGRKGLGVKDAAKRLREPLGVLANPILHRKHSEARELVLAVIADAAEGLLFDPKTGRIRAGLSNELRAAKSAAFQKIAEEAIA